MKKIKQIMFKVIFINASKLTNANVNHFIPQYKTNVFVNSFSTKIHNISLICNVYHAFALSSYTAHNEKCFYTVFFLGGWG